MKPARHLTIVAERPPAVDLYVNWRADIRARDWAAVHIAADKRQPIELAPARRWGWR